MPKGLQGFQKGHKWGFKKAYIPWNKGKKTPIEHRKKISEANKKVKHSSEWNEKVRKSKLGKPRLDLRGQNNPNWGGGRTLLRKKIRECLEYRIWRSDVFTRDNFTCQICGLKSGNGKAIWLEADHYPKAFVEILTKYKIESFEQAVACEELWNVGNGRTLCRVCHQNTDNHGRPARNRNR